MDAKARDMIWPAVKIVQGRFHRTVRYTDADWTRMLLANRNPSSIKPMLMKLRRSCKTQVSKPKIVKEFMTGLCTTPEESLTKRALWEAHKTYATSEDPRQAHARTLGVAVEELIKKKLVASEKNPNQANSVVES